MSRREKQRIQTKSTVLAKQRETKQTLYSFPFSVLVLVCDCSLVSSQLRVWVWDPFSVFIPKCWLQLLSLFTWLVFSCCLYTVASGCQLFPYFLPRIYYHMAFSFAFLQANQHSLKICCRYISIFHLDVHCYPSLDFLIRCFLLICSFLFHRLVVDL